MTYAAESTDLNAPSVLGTVASHIQLSVNHLGNVTSSHLDHYFPPATRKASKEWLLQLAQERPYLASFLLSQLVLSGPPLAFFLITTTTLVTLFILSGILVGLLAALFLTLIAIGIGLVLLLPVLFFTTISAISIWLWGSVIFYLVKRFNNDRVPSIKIPVTDLVSGLAKKASSFSPVSSGAAPATNTTTANGAHPTAASTAKLAETSEQDAVAN